MDRKKLNIPKTSKQGVIPKVTNKATTSKSGNQSSFQRSQKTHRTPTKASNQDTSVYLCQICSVEDGVEKVRCDKCTLWYHFLCANVTSDVENQDIWICAQCETSQTGGDVTVHEQQAVTIEDIIDDPSGSSKLPPSRSHKSSSITSTVSRRAALALQRLEEERQMNERREEEAMLRQRERDKKYLNQKYSILEDDEMSDLSFDDQELEFQKVESVRNWTESLPKNTDPLSLKDTEEVTNINEMPLSLPQLNSTNVNKQSNLEIVVAASNQTESVPSKQFVENIGGAMANNQQSVVTKQSIDQTQNPVISTKDTRVSVELPDWLTKPSTAEPVLTFPPNERMLVKQLIEDHVPNVLKSSTVTSYANTETRPLTMSAVFKNTQQQLAMAYNQMRRSQLSMRSNAGAATSNYNPTGLSQKMLEPSYQLPKEPRSSFNHLVGSNDHNTQMTFISNSSTLRPSYANVPQFQTATSNYQLMSSSHRNFDTNCPTTEPIQQPSSQLNVSESEVDLQPSVMPVGYQNMGNTSTFNDQFAGSDDQVYVSNTTATSSNYQQVNNQQHQPFETNQMPVISQPSMVYASGPTVSYQSQPSMIHATGPTVSYQFQPSVAYSNGPSVSNQAQPSVVNTTGPAARYQSQSSVVYSNGPSVSNQAQPSVVNTTGPAARYQSQSSVVYSNGPSVSYQQQPSVIYSSDSTFNFQQQPPMTYVSSFSRQQQPAVNQLVNMQQSMNFDGRLNQGHNDGNMSSQSTVANRSNSLGLTAEQIASRHVMSKDLPHFYGDPIEWLGFISAYENSTETCGYSNSENLGRLQKCLKGDAKEAVKGRLYHKDAVPGVIQTLRLLFGRPELIIEAMISNIQNIPRPKDDDLASLIKFAISVQNLSSTIQDVGACEHLRNPMVINSITDKLPAQLQLNWAFHKQTIGNTHIGHLGDWLYNIADVASQVVRVSSKSNNRKSATKETKDNKASKTNSSNSKPSSFLNTHVASHAKKDKNESAIKSKGNCPICCQSSCKQIKDCKKFVKLELKDRWAAIKDNHLCMRCFGNHRFNRCKSQQKCNVQNCQKSHHPLLHEYERRSDHKNQSSKDNSTKEEDDKTVALHRSIGERVDIFRIAPVILYHNDQLIRTFAYLDDGSNLTMIEDDLARKLNLDCSSEDNLCIKWSFKGIRREELVSRKVAVQISGVHTNAAKYDLHNVRTVDSLALPSQSLTQEWLNSFKHFKDIPITPYEDGKPRMLIGLQYSKLLVSLKTVEGNWSQPIVCKTRLGWIVQGPDGDDGDEVTNVESEINYSMSICECQQGDSQLHKMIKDFFSLENFGVKLTEKMLESREMQRARQILEATTVKINGRYETGLLWRYDDVELPNSYFMALKRLECLERKMKKDLKLAENMRNQIQDFERKGYIRKMTPEELQEKHSRTFYLPIFPVFNPKKPEKFRTVWDAAAKVKNISLNSMLLTGPDQLSPLPSVLRRFRERKYAVTGDIKEMYHQVRVKKSDTHAQRFLWRNGNTDREPDVYVMEVMTFGSTCSPSAAQFVKNKNAMEFKEKFPRAVEAIVDNHYIDDMLECTDTINDAVRLIKEVKSIHQAAGFEIGKFTSNSLEVLEKIGADMNHQNKNLNITEELSTERVLGMFWETLTDNFTYSLKFTKMDDEMFNGCRRPTKREVLRAVMSIFDPLGLIAHFLVYGKIILQRIWREGIEWDEPLSDLLFNQWRTWIQELPKIEEIQIPRLISSKLSPGTPKCIQLHVFVDASIDACTAAAYYRVEDEEGIDCSLIGAKTKVAPNKPLTIPRLELQSAVLGTRLADSINESQRIQVTKTFYWSDSQTVISWIRSEPRKYHQFVAFRIGEILESTSSSEWHWVNTKSNVADDGTKWKSNPDFSSTSRWYKGPSFLYQPQGEWNMTMDESCFTTEEEMRSVYVLAHLKLPVNHIIDPKRFSNWNRLKRSLAHAVRFFDNWKLKKADRKFGPFSRTEYLRASNLLYQQAQREEFMDEIVVIRNNLSLPIGEKKGFHKSSVLRTWSPYLDDNDVLRHGGRIDAAKNILFRTKRPIILPRNHFITKLIVFDYHRKYHHVNHKTTLNAIRQTFVIPGVSVVLKSVITHLCQRCKNDRAKPAIPEMSELPPARLATFTSAFTFVGVDYFGPMKVKVNRREVLRYGVLFTCLTSRAVHIEIAHSLNTSSCIMSIENFINIRGTPREIYSDNGSNFHGSEKVLREEFAKLNQHDIEEYFTDEHTQWSFNPPTGAHMGGCWERLIRSVKSILKKSMPTRLPTDEMLKNFLSEAANIINSRPLTYVPLDNIDDEVLTPNHLLLGSANGKRPPGKFDPKNLLRDDWKAVQQMANEFWQHFTADYLPTLTRRTKWFSDVKPLEVGDVCIVIDEDSERNSWPKAIVEDVFIGKGNKIRRARVRLIRGSKDKLASMDITKITHQTLIRPTAKLAVLDVKPPTTDEVKQELMEPVNEGKNVGQRNDSGNTDLQENHSTPELSDVLNQRH